MQGLSQHLGFVIKVVVASAAISLVIKYGAPLLAVPAMPTTALIGVFLPVIVLGAVLSWRA